MINTIIFDIGMVLVDFCWQDMLKNLGFEGETFEKVADATMRNPLWQDFDRGTWSTEELIRRFVANAPEYKTEIETVFQNMDKIVTLYDYSMDWIRQLKSDGYKVYILSNIPELVHLDNLDDKLRFLKEVDGAVLSYQERLLKPERRIYEVLCERYGIVPEQAVFFDDKQENVDAAREFGLNAICFKGYEQGIEELNKLL
ncbi:MAG: HAD family phosphatase [Lachnospiraceae bacterium]|nr:HAD family phosphatase [Lachnospiraceae bacterium]